MRTPARLVLLFVSIVAAAAGQDARHFAGSVHGSLPQFDFTISEADTGQSNGGKRIASIEVRSAGKRVQTIRYEDDDEAPIDFAPGNPVTLEDVNCDGYKDLLVRKFVGVHGDAWYFLYLFDSTAHRFLAYPAFAELAYRGVDCRTRLVKTYVNDGAAGCLYQAGSYHWVNHKLVPVRVESQDGDGNGPYERTIRVWQGGRERVVLKKSVPADDCHIANEALGQRRR